MFHFMNGTQLTYRDFKIIKSGSIKKLTTSKETINQISLFLSYFVFANPSSKVLANMMLMSVPIQMNSIENIKIAIEF